MNSYPPELLTQLAPVMFVAGLDPPPSPPIPLSQQIPQSPSRTTPPKPQQQDPFVLLTVRLREAFLSQRKVSIWAPEKSKVFQILPVDKAIRFPPRKLAPSQDSNTFSSSAVHSPLSPLTPSSPLFPDGLIAPIWIRKHTTLVPSVFVLFLRLFELPPHTPRSPLDPPDPDREREREREERRRDTELSAEVALRKKGTNERGIKLTVVLMASRRMLDDPSLDARLTYIRRQSGLDSRAALFVLSPVSIAELDDFVRSLQDALYEAAVDYYTTHSKRVRRKRNRHSQASVSHNPANPNAIRLRPEGWTVRYEYKMACFAEFRGEDEVALKHYQDAYTTLVIMFGSTAILPPRTKRWAEAKVLADSINVKICKLYLYNNEHALALSYHSTHMRKFADFSRGWGIGEETFEFWSWMARQHRILAELLEQGTRSTLTIPSHRPPPAALTSASAANAASTSGAQASRGTLEVESLRSLGLNPSHALQHPGFYYYMAARCTEKRRERFLALIEAEPTRGSTLSPGYANEKKVDHFTILLELYTKSYELFKKYSPMDSQNLGQGRLTLWIAYQIAQTYYDSSKFDMAVRFFERIAKTYRREKWGSMLRPLLSTWYKCAQELGVADLSVKLLVEMLGHGRRNDDDEPEISAENLRAVLQNTVPPSIGEPLIVDIPDSEPMFNSVVIFWTPEIKVGESVAFQLSLTAPSNINLSTLPVSSLAIHFTEDIISLTVQHAASGSAPKGVRLVELGHVSVHEKRTADLQADLRWNPGATIVFAGTTSSDVPTSMKISKLVLRLEENNWRIEIPFDPSRSREGSILIPRWLCSLDPVRFFPVTRDNYSIVTVRQRPHRLLVTLSHQAPAFLDEEYPIQINITNTDDRYMDVVVDVLLQPADVDHAVNHIVFDNERSTGLIKGVSFGVVAPGVNVLKTLYLVNTGAAGDRTLDISIQSRSTAKSLSSSASPDRVSYPSDTSEALQTLTVPTVNPINLSYDVGYKRVLVERPGLANLKTFEGDYWNDGEGGEALVSTRMEVMGPWDLEVLSVKLIRQDGNHARIIESSIDDHIDESFPAEYLPGDEFSDICRITLAPDEEHDGESRSIPGPGEYKITWRRLLPNGERFPTSTSCFALPPLRPPLDGLIALLSVPSAGKLHVPLTMSLKIRNLHHSRSANVTVQLEPEPSDAFVVSGLRSGRVPILLPGGEEQVIWRLIPVECGWVRVPKIKVVDRRTKGLGEAEAEGEVVKVVDVRWDRRETGQSRGDDGTDVRRSVDSSSEGASARDGGITSILVLP